MFSIILNIVIQPMILAVVISIAAASLIVYLIMRPHLLISKENGRKLNESLLENSDLRNGIIDAEKKISASQAMLDASNIEKNEIKKDLDNLSLKYQKLLSEYASLDANYNTLLDKQERSERDLEEKYKKMESEFKLLANSILEEKVKIFRAK
jgi:hypothetical protein